MQQPGMHEAYCASRPGTGHGLRCTPSRDLSVYGPGKNTVVPESVYWPPVRAGGNFQRTIFSGYLINHQERSHHSCCVA